MDDPMTIIFKNRHSSLPCGRDWLSHFPALLSLWLQVVSSPWTHSTARLILPNKREDYGSRRK